MMIGALYGLTGAIEFVAPDLLGNISWLVFGRIRTVHTNLVIFGFVVPALLSVGHFIVPHLLKTELYSEKLGVLSVVIWNIFTAAILITLSMGMSQAREYAEAIWPIDIAVAIVFVMMFINMIMTVRNRQEPILYVSVWYITAGIILSLFVYAIGNVVWVPGAGALTGIPDAVILWFYGHNVLGLLLTPLAVGIAYYVIPSATRSPLYSHTLSLVGFWSLLVLYSHIGTHHLLQVPAPTWLKVVSITGSIGMVIPVMVVLINLWFTAKGKLGVIQQNIGAKFVFAGSVIYLFTCIQGPMQSLPQVQRLTHFNNWVVAHAHMGVLGFSGMMAIGGIYYMLPIITGRPIFSRKLADFHYWMLLLGMAGFMVVLTMAGLVQGHGWLNGETIYRMLPQIHPYYIVRAGIGMLIVTGSIIGMYNITRTIFYKPGETA
jgi:cytochrome c oxidase cbb3-type subunit 1/cytochrome c oxidase cbb3-type subunit I/II